MLLRKIILSLTLAGGLAASATASADAPKSQCVLGSYGVTAVQPIRRIERFGHFESHRLVGARLFIPARPGLTPQWIQRNVDWHVAAMNGRPMAGCPMAVAAATVRVVSAETGFWVEITADSSASAKQILERARSVVR